jgi:hypothetical protein
MPKSTNTCDSILGLIFQGSAWADIAENDASAPLANLYLALYTDTPGVGDDPRTNEVTTGAYAGYVRKAVARSVVGWLTPSGGVTKNAATLAFVESTGGTGCTITHVAIVTTASGAGKVLYAGQLTAPRVIATGIQPQFLAEALVVTET